MMVFATIMFDHSLRLSQLYKTFPHGLYISDALWFLLAPLIWLYLKKRVGDSLLKWWDSLHLIPFIYMSHLFWPTLTAPVDMKLRFFEAFLASGRIHSWGVKVIILVMMIQIIGYLVASLKMLLQYERKYRQMASGNELQHLIKLRWTVMFFTAYFLFEFSFSTYRNFAGIQNQFIENWSLVMWTAFLILLTFTVVRDPKAVFASLKPIKPKFEGDDATELKNRLVAFMKSSFPFLDNSLTLPQLAESIQISASQLSFLLNSHMKTSFYDFINRHRVLHAANLLDNGEHRKLSIFGIAQASGFKSKASFYSFFKKEFGVTPTKYIEQKST